MATELITEHFVYQGEDIIPLKHSPLTGTILGFYTHLSKKTNLDIEPIGDNYININKGSLEIPLGVSISLTYKIEKDVSRFSLGERVKALETRVFKQQEKINVLEEALRHRVDINTFKTYLKSLEKKLNVDLIDNSYSPPYP